MCRSDLGATPIAPVVSFVPIVADEEVYCICKQVSYGEMIACENKECLIEWFHMECVGLSETPSVWYCKDCRDL